MGGVAVVLNPTTVADIGELKAEISQRANLAGLAEPLYLETTEDDPGAGMVVEAVRAGVRLILCCGGDGTVAACAGALADLAVDGSVAGVALAVVPIGTGNLLARNLDLPLGLPDALDVAFGPGRRPLDVLKAGEHRFVVMAGLGFDAALIRDTDDDLKGRIGWLAYLGGLAKAFKRSERAWFELTVDSAPPVRLRGVGVLVGNVGQVQGGLALLPDARPDDGVADVIVLSPRRQSDWPLLIWRLIRRQTDHGSRAHVFRGTTMTITADRELPVEYDGDFDGAAAGMRVEVMARAIVLCVPEGRAPAIPAEWDGRTAR
jgi:diacylglycerol kinase family enzyme